MYSINFSWPEKGINTVIDSENSWSLRDSFRILKLNQAFVADFSPPIDTDSGVFRSVMVSDISVYNNELSCNYFNTMTQSSDAYQDMTITVRKMSILFYFICLFLSFSLDRLDFYPHNLNDRISSDQRCKINIFITENGEFEYISTEACILRNLKSKIEKVLNDSNWSTTDYEVSYFVDQNETVVFMERDLNDIVLNGQKVMNIGINAQKPSKKYLLLMNFMFID